jgi:hypothetical protein
MARCQGRRSSSRWRLDPGRRRQVVAIEPADSAHSVSLIIRLVCRTSDLFRSQR